MILLIQIFFSSKQGCHLARKSLIAETNFDLPESSQSDNFILLRVVFRTYRSIFRAKLASNKNLPTCKVAGIGESSLVWPSHQKFNCDNHLPPIELKISYVHLMDQMSVLEKLTALCIPLLVSPLVFIPAVFSKRKASYAICVLYSVYIFLILQRTKRCHVKTVIDYTAYANQSNWLAWALMKRGIEVIKIPSIVPLAGHFKHVIASKLWLSTPYHQDEVKAFASTHLVGEYLNGTPKNSFYLDKYKAAKIKATPFVLGYYSHASWLRADEDHGVSEFGLPEMEAAVLRYLVEYCRLHPEIKLHLFTHPRERKHEILNRTKHYYNEVIASDIRHEIYYGDDKSSLSFEAAEVGVGTMSSILFERLLCGFKTLFYTESMTSFPVPNSDISAICAPNKNKLFKMLDEQFANAGHPILDQYRYDSEFYTRKQ